MFLYDEEVENRRSFKFIKIEAGKVLLVRKQTTRPATCILACFLQLDTIHTLENQIRIICPKSFLQTNQLYTHMRI